MVRTGFWPGFGEAGGRLTGGVWGGGSPPSLGRSRVRCVSFFLGVWDGGWEMEDSSAAAVAAVAAALPLSHMSMFKFHIKNTKKTLFFRKKKINAARTP